MATILAANTGNWSATGTWTGGVVPVAGDVVVANGKTVTIDTLNVTVAELRNDTTGGAAAGGTFNLVSGGTVNANVYAGSTTTSCVTWAGIAGQTATITGQFFGGNNQNAAISCTGGNLICGAGSQATGGFGSDSRGIFFSSSGSFTFATSGSPGVITGGTSSSFNANGIFCNTANSTITIYASSIRGTSSGSGYGLQFTGANQNVTVVAGSIGASNQTAAAITCGGASSTHTYTVSGDVQGGSSGPGYGITVSTSGTYNITLSGTLIAGTGNGTYALGSNSTATINLTANVTNTVSSSAGTNYSVNNTGTGTVNVTGTVTAGNANSTAWNNSTGIIRVTRAKGNGYGAGSAGINATSALISANQGSLTYVEEIEFGSLGATPVSGPIRFTNVTSNKCIVTTTTGSFKTLIDTAATSGILPAVTDVRTGVVYSSGNLTGTCAVPAAGSVALGVPVDATTGTAVLTAAAVRTAVGLASANLDAQLATAAADSSGVTTLLSRLTSTRATGLDNLDATVSSRLATSGYTAPLDAGATRSALGLASANLDTQLAAIPTTAAPSAATVTSAVWAAASRTITGGTVDTLTNAPSVPSAAQIASQVRTELTTELGRIDAAVSSRSTYAGADTTGTTSLLSRLTSTRAAALDNLDATVSSRLAAASYTAAPTTGAIRTELSVELARIDAAISTRLAPSGTLARVTLVDTATTLTNAPTVPSAAEIATAVNTELADDFRSVKNTVIATSVL